VFVVMFPGRGRSCFLGGRGRLRDFSICREKQT
jgi:hypothetical protein